MRRPGPTRAVEVHEIFDLWFISQTTGEFGSKLLQLQKNRNTFVAPVRTGFVVDKVEIVQYFLRVFRFSLFIVILPMLHTLLHPKQTALCNFGNLRR